MTDRELMQMALDALELVTDLTSHDDEVYEAIDALRARLAQPEPEELARLEQAMIEAWKPIPQREWQGLTDEEIKSAWSQLWHDLGNGKFAASDDPSRHTTVMFARAIEAKLKEKNT